MGGMVEVEVSGGGISTRVLGVGISSIRGVWGEVVGGGVSSRSGRWGY